MKNIERWKIAKEVYEEWNNAPNCNPPSFKDWIDSKTDPNLLSINILEDKLLKIFPQGYVGRGMIEKALKDAREEMENEQ